MGNHALLSASSSHRWLNCPPSARLGENYEDKGSDFAAEGTDAHSLCEHKLKTALGIPSEDPTENLTWYNEEMEECASGYSAYVLELLTEAKKVTTDPIVLIEQRLDYSKYVESGFGTGDCVLIADGTLNIVDYKHGKGVEVSADHNPQMMLYALGALEIFDALYDIDTVTMTIYQPRRSNVSTYTVSTAELLEWAETVLKPTAALAFSGEGEFHCGEWCQFCKAKADCRERAKANLALAAYDFAEPPLLTDEEVEEVLAKVDDLVSWANDIKEYALQAAISGKAWNGWKVVEGRSNRKYTDERLVAAAVIAAGHDPYEQKLLGITEMQKTLGNSYGEIADRLIAEGVPTRMPGASWAKTTVQHIIRNEKYCGDCLFQKAFIANPITHQQVRNNGELPKYLVEDCLPAIVDKETWKLAQAVAARHTSHRQAPNERYPFTGKLFCGVCGKPYYYYHYTTTNKQPLAAYRCMSRKTQSAVEVPGQTYTPPHKATFNLNASPELIAYRERYCKPPKERPMLCTDIRISIDLPQKAFCRAWNLIVAKKLRYQATLRSTVDNAEDILVRYRAEEMCLLIDEIGKINEFSYPLMLKTLNRVVVNANGKLTFIFQSGIKITV